MRYRRMLGAWLIGAATATTLHAEPAKPPTREEVLAERIAEVSQILEANPKSVEAHVARARLYSLAEDHAKAIADYDAVIAVDPQRADAFDQRGSQRFMAGDIDGSIADFDRFLQLRPDQVPWHWRRGLSYYYAGRWDEGSRQFEGYQTVDDNDVENVVWRFLCMARSAGVPKAREAMLTVRNDARVPMMQVYALYRGEARPEDVMTAATQGNPPADALRERLFYAHLYLGLYYEAMGDAKLARQHITTAADKYKIGHYMWHVADVHARRFRAADAAP